MDYAEILEIMCSDLWSFPSNVETGSMEHYRYRNRCCFYLCSNNAAKSRLTMIPFKDNHFVFVIDEKFISTYLNYLNIFRVVDGTNEKSITNSPMEFEEFLCKARPMEHYTPRSRTHFMFCSNHVPRDKQITEQKCVKNYLLDKVELRRLLYGDWPYLDKAEICPTIEYIHNHLCFLLFCLDHDPIGRWVMHIQFETLTFGRPKVGSLLIFLKDNFFVFVIDEKFISTYLNYLNVLRVVDGTNEKSITSAPTKFEDFLCKHPN